MHRAWLIVAFVFATNFVGNAVGFYAFGVLLAPIAEEFGTSRASAGMILFVLSWAGAAVGPFVGQAVTRFAIHRIMITGALTMGLAFLAMSHAAALWHLGLGYGLGVALGINTLAGVASSTLIVNWFNQRRAFALGVAGVGISFAGFVMTPVTASWVQNYGWRTTYEIFGWSSLAMIPPIWWPATPGTGASSPTGRR